MNSTDQKSEVIRKLAVCLAIIASLTGCGGSSSMGKGGSGGTNPPSEAKNVYVIQAPVSYGASSGSILQFSATASGSVSPVSTIIAPTDTAFQGLVTDSDGNIYVGGYAGPPKYPMSLLEYSAGASGSAAPKATIPSNDTTKMWDPDGLAIGPDGQIIVGEDNGGVATYSATANGSVAPEYYILGESETGGGLSTINAAQSVAVGSGNIYVFNWQEGTSAAPIAIFSATDTGNVAPSGTIGGPLTGITFDGVGGIATDSSGNVYISASGAQGGSILVFPPTATGDVAPARTISGSSTQLGYLGGIRLDPVGNIYVISVDIHGENPTVLKFSATASGNTAPTSSFTSSTWTRPDNYISLAVY
jgi:hypothetical protein